MRPDVRFAPASSSSRQDAVREGFCRRPAGCSARGRGGRILSAGRLQEERRQQLKWLLAGCVRGAHGAGRGPARGPTRGVREGLGYGWGGGAAGKRTRG